LLAQLAAFKAGERQNEMMSIVSEDLSPTDIEDLAAYYSAIEISVGKVPGQ
jgi:cytochrome c553